MSQPDAQARDSLISQAQTAFQTNRVEDARALFERAYALDSEHLPLKLMYGVACARSGNRQLAEKLLLEVVERDPSSFEALLSLASLHREQGELEKASDEGFRAVKLNPTEPLAHYNYGLTWMAARRPERAAVAFAKAVEIRPNFGPAIHQLGRAFQGMGKFKEAAQTFERAVQQNPRFENYLAFAQVLNKMEEFEASVKAATEALKLNSSFVATYLVLANSLFALGRRDEAQAYLDNAILLDSAGNEAYDIGLTQRMAGDLVGSNASFRRAIEKDPSAPRPYAQLVHNTKIGEPDRFLVQNMRSLIDRDSPQPGDRCDLHYGLGKALEDLGEYEESMCHYDEANRLAKQIKLGDSAFDRDALKRRIDQAIDSLKPSDLEKAAREDGRSQSELPVVIVGMMRSGTTLVEQILSNHSKVSAAGEQQFWLQHWDQAFGSGNGTSPAEFDLGETANLGHDYLRLLRKFSPTADRITDKMPNNSLCLGLIHLALPNARIVHVRRNPIDNALSIWTTPNRAPSDGGHDKENFMFLFQEFIRLMDHFRNVLPKERFLEIDYEELVADQEMVTRTLVEYCGLEWDDACLRPEDNPRSVLTPSMWQVRQPVYQTSAGRWRKYEPWLGQFQQLSELKHPAKRQ